LTKNWQYKNFIENPKGKKLEAQTKKSELIIKNSGTTDPVKRDYFKSSLKLLAPSLLTIAKIKTIQKTLLHNASAGP